MAFTCLHSQIHEPTSSLPDNTNTSTLDNVFQYLITQKNKNMLNRTNLAQWITLWSAHSVNKFLPPAKISSNSVFGIFGGVRIGI